MARRAKKASEAEPAASEDQIPETILDHMARNNPPPAAAPSPQVDVEGLLKQIAELKSNQERLERTNMALMSQPPAPQWSPPPAAVPQTPPAPLPDPLQDAEGFGNALVNRISGQLTAQMAQKQAEEARQRAESQRVEHMWASFEAKYPDLAEHEDLVEVAATKVLKDMTVRGVDVTKYMTMATDQFFSDVATRMKQDYGKLFEAEPVTNAPSKAHASAVQRTGGIFGGTDTGGTPAKPAEAKPGDLIEDMVALQRKSGYY